MAPRKTAFVTALSVLIAYTIGIFRGAGMITTVIKGSLI